MSCHETNVTTRICKDGTAYSNMRLCQDKFYKETGQASPRNYKESGCQGKSSGKDNLQEQKAGLLEYLSSLFQGQVVVNILLQSQRRLENVYRA